MTQRRNDDEWRKSITALMRAGTTYIPIDNITEILGLGELSAVLTTNYWKDRVLGVSEAANWPVRATWVATGNNLPVAT